MCLDHKILLFSHEEKILSANKTHTYIHPKAFKKARFENLMMSFVQKLLETSTFVLAVKRPIFQK